MKQKKPSEGDEIDKMADHAGIKCNIKVRRMDQMGNNYS